MRLLLLLLLLCLSASGIEKVEKKYVANKKLSLKIELKNGVIFNEAFIAKESTGKVFSYETLNVELKPSVLVPRSYGIINIPLTFIKKITENIEKPFIESAHKFEWQMDMLNMIDSSDISRRGEIFTDDSLEHLPELAPILVELYLFKTKITESSTDKLSKLKRLTHLSVNDSFSSEAKDKLKKALPGTKIIP